MLWYLHQVDDGACGGPYVVTFLNWTPILEWYMASLVV